MKQYILPLLLCAFGLSAFAQDEGEEVKGFDRNKLFFGGNFALGFGNISTIVNVSPQIGYRFNRYLAAGVGVNAQYSSFKSRYINGATASRESYGVAGFNIFGRVYPIEQILLQVQPEMNYTWGKLKLYGPPDQEIKLDGKFVPSILLGAGGAIPAGRGAVLIMIQYDVLQHERTPYGSRAFYSIGYNMGF